MTEKILTIKDTGKEPHPGPKTSMRTTGKIRKTKKQHAKDEATNDSFLEGGMYAIDTSLWQEGGGYGIVATGIGVLKTRALKKSIRKSAQVHGKISSKESIVDAHHQYARELKLYAWWISTFGVALQVGIEVATATIPAVNQLPAPRNVGHTTFSLGVSLAVEAQVHREAVSQMEGAPAEDQAHMNEGQRFIETLSTKTISKSRLVAMGAVAAPLAAHGLQVATGFGIGPLGYMMGIVLGASSAQNMVDGAIKRRANKKLEEQRLENPNVDGHKQFHKNMAPNELAAGIGMMAAGFAIALAAKPIMNPFMATGGMILFFKGLNTFCKGIVRQINKDKLKSRYDQPGGTFELAKMAAFELMNIGQDFCSSLYAGRNRGKIEQMEANHTTVEEKFGRLARAGKQKIGVQLSKIAEMKAWLRKSAHSR